MAAKEDELLAEIEAVQAVYGSDCLVLGSSPAHLHISLKPRTADVSSEQFVEATVEIRATLQYPKEPPSIVLVDCKGLDEQRQKNLLNYIQRKGCELSPYLMLVALCEEAVEKLSALNHPDGDCPLCLFPLVPEDQQCETLPFMKLMSCFHCFHRECIIRWWHWLKNSKEIDSYTAVSATTHPTKDDYEKIDEGVGSCPVCRKLFHAKDLEHVRILVDSRCSQLGLDNDETSDDEKLLQSEYEIIRRQKFEAILNLQNKNSGLIEPKRDLVVLPGMYLPQPVAIPSSLSTKESDERPQKDLPAVVSVKHGSGTSIGHSSNRHRNFGSRKQRARSDHHSNLTYGKNPRKPAQQWVRREDPNSKQ